MATIQLPYLEETTTVEQGDLLLARKSGETTDKKIKFSNLCKSIGNSSMLGYKATVINTTDTIITLNLTPLNNVPIPYTIVSTNKHPDFPADTLIFFTFPKDYKGKIEAKILDKTYNINVSSDDSSYFSCREGDYFIIKYVPTQSVSTTFVRINDYDHIISSNIYDVTAVVKETTKVILKLSSSGGIQKQKYFKGMEIYFIPTETIVSNDINVIIDDLLVLNKQSLKFEDATLKTTIVAGREVRAVYDGSNFIIKSQDYPQLLPDINWTTAVNNIFYLSFYDQAYTSIKTPTFIFTLKSDGSGNYSTLEDAIYDLESRFASNKNNIKVQLVISDITIDRTIIIAKDLSYIQLVGTNNIIPIKCNMTNTAFWIVGQGHFFSVTANTTFKVSTDKIVNEKEQFDFIHIHNYSCNIFESFTILLDSFSDNRSIGEIFRITYSMGGLHLKKITVSDSNFVSGQSKYTYGIGLGLYTSHVYLNDVVLKHRKSGNAALIMHGKVYHNNLTQYFSYSHRVFMTNCDFTSNNIISAQDIVFMNKTSDDKTVTGYAIVHQINSIAGCNKGVNTKDPSWGEYIVAGDRETRSIN